MIFHYKVHEVTFSHFLVELLLYWPPVIMQAFPTKF